MIQGLGLLDLVMFGYKVPKADVPMTHKEVK